MLRHQ